jgi:hypothetical protein
MPEFEIVRWHCHGKKAHKSKKAHGKHGCTKAKKGKRAALRTAARK